MVVTQPEMTKRLTSERRNEIFHVVSERMLSTWGEAAPRLCLHWAHYTIAALKKIGVTACLQAGDAFWPVVPPDQWEYSKQPINNFGYAWSDLNLPQVDFARRAMAVADGAVLPEIPAWVGIVDTQELIDLTTGFWVDNLRGMFPQPWLAATPPPYLWSTMDEMPDHVYYRPHQEATLFAALVLRLIDMKGELPPL